MKKTNEEYNNLIELLKQALKFYANEKNYEDEVQYERTSLIELDAGTQAKFALEKIGTFKKEFDEGEKEFVENLKKAIEANDDHETMMGLIETYKKERE